MYRYVDCLQFPGELFEWRAIVDRREFQVWPGKVLRLTTCSNIFARGQPYFCVIFGEKAEYFPQRGAPSSFRFLVRPV